MENYPPRTYVSSLRMLPFPHPQRLPLCTSCAAGSSHSPVLPVLSARSGDLCARSMQRPGAMPPSPQKQTNLAQAAPVLRSCGRSRSWQRNPWEWGTGLHWTVRNHGIGLVIVYFVCCKLRFAADPKNNMPNMPEIADCDRTIEVDGKFKYHPPIDLCCLPRGERSLPNPLGLKLGLEMKSKILQMQ